MTYTITFSRQAKRALEIELPEGVAVACYEFIIGPLADQPHRVGKPLAEPLDSLRSARRGEYRVIYEINETKVIVHVVTIRHRRDAYRT